jgi:hypothetical protein
MALNVGQILGDMVGAAKSTAADQWGEIKTAVTFEMRMLAQRIVQIVKLRTSGQIDNDDAKLFFLMARNNGVAAIAMATALTGIAVQKIMDAALGVVKTTVNSAIGFALI